MLEEPLTPDEVLDGIENMVRAVRRDHDKLKACEEVKDRVYKERNQLILLLAKIFPAHLSRHPDGDPEFETDWRWIVCIHIPHEAAEGGFIQACWHIHDSEKEAFSFLQELENDWDGHTNEEKYSRLSSLSSQDLSHAICSQDIPVPEEGSVHAQVLKGKNS